ncbi:MAG: YgeY family selenium metabolism-linked hydrolase [Chloroflexota bacterium]|nr:MAG: YgeY family selenium metabolism-linked hydrolase [Chloroflexota bacterium]
MQSQTVSQDKIEQIRKRVEEQREDIITFLRELCAIPSYDSQIRAVGERAEAEMRKLGFDDVWFDRMGNVIGKIGDGPVKLLYDSHIDTVGIGDPDEWEWDPFEGKIENGVFFARGACDEKGSTPGMIYGLALAKELGLLEGVTGYYFGNMEEWCDGIAPHALVEAEGLRPDFVVIGEPTKMQVYRGHKGRVEMQVVAKGKSAHAASNFLGDNAIYKILPIIDAISKLEPELGDDPFLGHGRITVTDMRVKTPSINAVPDEALIYIDRRVTFGEDPQAELERIRRLIGDRDDIEASILFYDEPSYTGFVFPVDKIFPAWALPEDHAFVQAGVAAGQLLWGEPLPTGKWDFSTNGIYWMGKAGIPSIGFGPGDEIHAHTVIDQVKLDDVVKATEWYALLPALLK